MIEPWLCYIDLLQSQVQTLPSSYFYNLYFFFETESYFVEPGWRAMVQSRLIATSASWVQAIPLPQPLE